jgi:cell division protease FtsH
MNAKEKEITAFHEAGHAIVAHMLPLAHPVNKVSIISRGRAGGFTWQLPDEDRHLTSVGDYKDDMAVMLGGRMAEEIIFGDITNGASSDLQKATQMARHMIMANGMSTKLPNRVFGSQDSAVFLGRDFSEGKNYSEDVAKTIDEEVAGLIDEAAKRAGKVIRDNRDKVDKIAAKLVKDEVIDRDEFTDLIGPRPNAVVKTEDPRKDGVESQDIGPDITGSPAAA